MGGLERLIVTISLAPLLVSLVVGWYFAGQLCRRSQGAKEQAWATSTAAEVTVLICYLCFPPVCATILQTTRPCQQLEDGMYMHIDYRIRCDTGEHTTVVGLAWVALVFYLGVPLQLWHRLFRGRGQLSIYQRTCKGYISASWGGELGTHSSRHFVHIDCLGHYGYGCR